MGPLSVPDSSKTSSTTSVQDTCLSSGSGFVRTPDAWIITYVQPSKRAIWYLGWQCRRTLPFEQPAKFALEGCRYMYNMGPRGSSYTRAISKLGIASPRLRRSLHLIRTASIRVNLDFTRSYRRPIPNLFETPVSAIAMSMSERHYQNDRSRTKLTQLLGMQAELPEPGKSRPKSLKSWPNPGQIWPNSGQILTKSGQYRS